MSRLWSAEGFDPLWGLRAMQRELARVFNRPDAGAFPLVNVYDHGDAFVVEAVLPGVGTSELDLTITGDTLEIKGKRPGLPDVPGERFHHHERRGGSFARTVVLPDGVQAEGVKAKQRHGILTVHLPKSEATQPRRVAVESS